MDLENLKTSDEKLPPLKDLNIERGLLRVESTFEASKGLAAKAREAKNKYYPRYWYCSDLILKYIEKSKSELRSSPAFLVTYQEAMTNLAQLNAALDRVMEVSEEPFPETFVSDQGLSPHIVEQLKNKASKDLLPALMKNGINGPERLAWIGLYLLSKESSKKTEAESKDLTLDLERQWNAILKVVDVPLLLADFYRIFPKP